MKFTQFFVIRILLVLSLFSFADIKASPLTPEEQRVMRTFSKYIGPKITLDEKLCAIGFKHAGNNNMSASEFYQKGLQLRKGQVKGLEEETFERLVFQLMCFTDIPASKDDFHRLVMHNKATTQIALAEQLKKREDNSEHNKMILPILYQEAWYLFSLADLPESRTNLTRLVQNGSIAFIIDNYEYHLKPKESFFSIVERDIDEKNRQFLAETEDVSRFAANLVVNKMADLFEKQCGIPKERTLSLLTTEEARREFQRNTDCVNSVMSRGLENEKNAFLQSPIQLRIEEMGAAKKQETVDPVVFNDATFGDLTRLFGQLIITVKKTPKLFLEEEPPVTVFIGRSTSWLSLMQQNIKIRLPQTLLFKHALASGLRQEPSTEVQLIGYKRYLDSLGFGELSRTRPILLTDVAETGESLKRFGEIIKQFYDFKNVQYIAMMHFGQTLNLERTRTIFLTPALAKVMFAKHDSLARFCPFSQLYPTQWIDWQRYVNDFKPQKEALVLKDQLKEWMASPVGEKHLSPIFDFAHNL